MAIGSPYLCVFLFLMSDIEKEVLSVPTLNL